MTTSVCERDAKRHKKALVKLTNAVRMYLEQLDKVMEGPSTPERGQQIAQLSNALELANDSARHFGLGIDLKTGKTQKPKAAKKG